MREHWMREVFEQFFARRYAALFGAIHGHGWHVMLHSCGRINALVPRLIELGVDAFNLQQPRACGSPYCNDRARSARDRK